MMKSSKELFNSFSEEYLQSQPEASELPQKSFQDLKISFSDECSTFLDTARNSTYPLQSWNLDTYLDEDDDFHLLQQSLMCREDYRSHELRKSSWQAVRNLQAYKIEVDCSKSELYEFHSNLVSILSLVEDGMNDAFGIQLANCLLLINLKSSGIQLTDSRTLLENFEHFSDTMQASMEEAFRNIDVPAPSLPSPAKSVSRKQDSLKNKIEWELLELSSLKQEYANCLLYTSDAADE